jgi:probable FeS assembly SUF system protein SufT
MEMWTADVPFLCGGRNPQSHQRPPNAESRDSHEGRERRESNSQPASRGVRKGMSASISLLRDVVAIQIPSGNQVVLPAGTEVLITQQLGDSYTVHVASQAGLFRIQGPDADALGREMLAATVTEGPFSEEKVWEQLRQCYDPEIPVNIVDLGLIYSVDVGDDESGKGKRIGVKMTLTAPGCGMGPTLARDAEHRILTVGGVASANVELVWDPPWSPERISQAGRERLGMV